MKKSIKATGHAAGSTLATVAWSFSAVLPVSTCVVSRDEQK